jgi:putative large structural protein
VYANGTAVLSASADIKAIRLYQGFGERSALETLVSQRNAGCTLESVQEADFWGMDELGYWTTVQTPNIGGGGGTMDVYMSSYNPFPLTLPGSQTGTAEHFKDVGDAVFTYGACGIGGWAGIPLIFCSTFGETKFGVSLKYTWYNQTADTNRATWQGYKNELGTNTTRFRDVLAPAIDTWEKSVADYQSKYDAWKVQAGNEVNANNQAFDQAQDALIRSRNAWLGSYEEQARKSDEAWAVFDVAYNSRKEEFQAATKAKTEEEIKKQFHADTDKFLEGIPVPIRMTPAVKEMLSDLRGRISSIETTALHAASPNLPDSEIIQQLNDAFKTAFEASMNAALMHEMNDRSDDAREDFVGQVKKLAASINGTIYQTMNGDKIAEQLLAADPSLKNDQQKLQTLVRDQLKGKTDEGFSVTVNEDGSITVKRQIPSGR